MKAAILGDTHFLVRNGSKSFNAYFEKFYSEVFFPHLNNNNIKTIIQLGDLFDNRKTAHIQGLSECKRYFFDKLEEYDIEMITLVGNHDSHYKDTISINSPKLLLGEYRKLMIFESPANFELSYGTEICIIPWICQENFEETMKVVSSSKSDFCFGHLELRDFAMHKGIVSDEGMSPDIFDKFEFVMTGHYHHRSNRGNIYYLGTPCELTWHDNSDPKGFHVFDFSTRELEFVQNPFRMFNKLYYDDLLMEDELKDNIENSKLDEYSGTYLKVVVKNKQNPYLFDLYIDALYKINPIDLVIIEEVSEVLSEEIHDIDETEDTLTTLSRFVDNVKTKDLDTHKVKSILGSLYNEAISLDII